MAEWGVGYTPGSGDRAWSSDQETLKSLLQIDAEGRGSVSPSARCCCGLLFVGLT